MGAYLGGDILCRLPVMGRKLIPYLRRLKLGRRYRVAQTGTCRRTPVMGGLMFIFSTLVSLRPIFYIQSGRHDLLAVFFWGFLRCNQLSRRL